MTANGNPQSLVLCILDVSVVCVAWICTPDRCRIVEDRSPICPSNVSFWCLQDVPAKACFYWILSLLRSRCAC